MKINGTNGPAVNFTPADKTQTDNRVKKVNKAFTQLKNDLLKSGAEKKEDK